VLESEAEVDFVVGVEAEASDSTAAVDVARAPEGMRRDRSEAGRLTERIWGI